MEKEKGRGCSKRMLIGEFQEGNEIKEVRIPKCIYQTEDGHYCEDEDAWQDCQEGGQKRKKQKYLFQDFLDEPMPSETKSSGK